jgi:hypothetical protein
MSYYDIILQDLFIENEIAVELQATPYNDNMEEKNKLEITFRCLLRAQRLRQRIPALIFAYFLGQLIENGESSKRNIKRVITEHYYTIAVRTYYIFEVNPIQIYATKNVSTTMVRKLKQSEFKKLTVEL